jgi:hypothetical protein
MKIIFPNPYGFKLPTKERIENLLQKYQLSEDYSCFLLNQNGLLIDKIDDDENKLNFLKQPEVSEQNNIASSDIRCLYGIDADIEGYDFENNFESFIFSEYLLPIGIDCGGNEFVEIRGGRFKGYIASLDHEMYLSSESIDEFIEEFELTGFEDASFDEKVDMLCDQEMGVAWVIALSMNDFLEKCIHCDENFSGYVLDIANIG